jgi:predicted DsbA family dithiol-disulfide isomerase
MLHPIMKSMVAQYAGQARFVYKPIALPQFPYSTRQNAVLFAADEEGKFTEMLDLQLERQQRGGLTHAQLKEFATMIGMDPDTMEKRVTEGRYDDRIQRNNEQATKAGVSRVPTVLIDGQFVTPTSRSAACLSQFIEEALGNDGPDG